MTIAVYKILLMALAGFSLTGCMSTINLQGDSGLIKVREEWPYFHWDTTPYGGVKLDAKLGAKCVAGVFTDPEARPLQRASGLVGAAFLFGVDMPVSIVVDTVTLPIAIHKARMREESLPLQPVGEPATWKGDSRHLYVTEYERRRSRGEGAAGEPASGHHDGKQVHLPDGFRQYVGSLNPGAIKEVRPD